jgi:hypothetical protein
MPKDGIVCFDNGMYKVWFERNYRTHEADTPDFQMRRSLWRKGLTAGDFEPRERFEPSVPVSGTSVFRGRPIRTLRHFSYREKTDSCESDREFESFSHQ